jgi:threonine dehydratase
MPQNLVYINGFDHPNIIAGAGTMAIEMLNQVRACCLWAVPCYSRASLTFSNALGA